MPMITLLLSLTVSGPASTGQPLSQTAVEQPADPDAAARALYQEGEAHFRASRYPQAIRSFGEALELVQDQVIHARLMLNIAAAHQREFDFGGDILQLQKAKSIYERYLMLADGGLAYPPEDVAEVRAQRDRIARQLDESRKARMNRKRRNKQIASTAVSEDPAPHASARQQAVDTSPAADRSTPAWRPVALLAGGSAVAVGGLGILITGATYRGRAERAVKEYTGGAREHPAAMAGEEYIDMAEGRGKLLMGIGGTLAAVGIGTVVLGVLDRRKQRQADVAVAPMVGPRSAQVVLTGRF